MENVPKPADQAQSQIKPPEIVMIPIVDLAVPSWNPRPFLEEDEMQMLVDYLKNGGTLDRITVWKGNRQAPWAIVSGQRRAEAFKRLGRTHIEAEILDISLEDAMFRALTSNRDNKPYWLGEFMALENLRNLTGLKQKELAAKTGWSSYRISCAFSLMELLSPATRQLILQTARQGVRLSNFSEVENDNDSNNVKIWCLTEKAACRLIRLLDNRKLDDARLLADKILPILLEKQLNGPQTQEFVAHAVSGKDLDQFEAEKKARKPRSKPAGNIQKDPQELEGRSEELGVNEKSEIARKNLNGRLEEATSGGKALTLWEKLALGLASLRPKSISDQDKVNAPNSPDVPNEAIPAPQPSSAQAHPPHPLNPSPFDGLRAGKSLEAYLKFLGHHAWLAARAIFKYLFKFIKFPLRASIYLANKLAPQSHSGSHSGHSRGGNSLSRLLAHWGLFLLMVPLAYGIFFGIVELVIGYFVPSWGDRFDAVSGVIWNIAFIQFPLYVVSQIPHSPKLALGLAVISLLVVKEVLNPGIGKLSIIGFLLVMAWFTRSLWEGYLPKAQAPSFSNWRTICGLEKPELKKQLEIRSEELGVANGNKNTQIGNVKKETGISHSDKSNANQEIVHSPLHGGERTKGVESVHSASSSKPAKPWSAEDVDYNCLVNEIYPVPEYCVIQSFNPGLDSRLDEDTAGSYLAALQDGEKYSMWFGNDKVKVTSALPSRTGLILHFKLPGDEGWRVGFDWTELKTIHSDKLLVYSGKYQSQTIYQCGLVIPHLKKAITFECRSKRELGNLVSAMEYWAKGVLGGKAIPVSGLPYLHQGVLFVDKSVAAVLWTGSPVYKTGLKLGDVIWNVDKADGSQRETGELEKELKNLTPGKHVLFILPGGDENAPRKKLKMTVQYLNGK